MYACTSLNVLIRRYLVKSSPLPDYPILNCTHCIWMCWLLTPDLIAERVLLFFFLLNFIAVWSPHLCPPRDILSSLSISSVWESTAPRVFPLTCSLVFYSSGTNQFILSVCLLSFHIQILNSSPRKKKMIKISAIKLK